MVGKLHCCICCFKETGASCRWRGGSAIGLIAEKLVTAERWGLFEVRTSTNGSNPAHGDGKRKGAATQAPRPPSQASARPSPSNVQDPRVRPRPPLAPARLSPLPPPVPTPPP